MYYPKNKESRDSSSTLCPLLVAATIAYHGKIKDGKGVVKQLSCSPSCGWWCDWCNACAMIDIAFSIGTE